MTGVRRLPRTLHPVAWWIWAFALVVAASRTTNPLLLLLVLAVLAYVVSARRTDTPWARALPYYGWLAAIVVLIQVLFGAVFTGAAQPGDHVLLTLPRIPLPHWYAGVRIGGPVTLEGTLTSAASGLRLGTMLCCVGAANALANPKRALRVLPGALYELGTATVVAITLAPQLIESVTRVARARRLRGGRRRGLRALEGIALPVLADALERSLQLAAAMDSRGYGRRGPVTLAERRRTGALLLAGMAGLLIGCYGLLAGSGPRTLGLIALGAGVALCVGGLRAGGRRVQRTRYRPDPWRAPEWTVAGCGILAAGLLYLSAGYDADALAPSFSPLRVPPLPLLPAVAVGLAALAGVAAPPPPRPSAPAHRAPGPTAGREAIPA